MNEKAKLQITGYKPQVIVTTKIDPAQGAVAKVEISVADNGNGIPKKNKRENISAVLYHQANRFRDRAGIESEL